MCTTLSGALLLKLWVSFIIGVMAGLKNNNNNIHFVPEFAAYPW